MTQLHALFEGVPAERVFDADAGQNPRTIPVGFALFNFIRNGRNYLVVLPGPDHPDYRPRDAAGRPNPVLRLNEHQMPLRHDIVVRKLQRPTEAFSVDGGDVSTVAPQIPAVVEAGRVLPGMIFC